MSLVEKALRKLQDSRSTGGGDAKEVLDDIVVGSVVSTGAYPRPEFGGGADVDIPHRGGPRTDKLITIDRKLLRSTGLMPAEDQERRFANEYRQIKRPLIAFSRENVDPKHSGRLIMLTSALPGEGKTFTTINLAMSMAREKDLHILLVDADVAKPHISRTFGVDQEAGLLDSLGDDRTDVESLVVPTDIPGLSILPAGHQSENATELLASQRMERMAAALASRSPNRIVLFDSSPLLLTSESRVLANMVGQIVLVVRAGATSPQAVMDAVSSLGSNWETKNVGLVLNQSEAADPGTYYGYGDYYGAGAQAQTKS